MVKKMRKVIIPIMLLGLLVALAFSVSIAKFNVNNPLAVLNGLFQITFTDAEYIEIQAYPKVIVAKAQTSLENFMKEHGYTEIKEEQSGAIRLFASEIDHEFVSWSANQYFATWQWRE